MACQSTSTAAKQSAQVAADTGYQQMWVNDSIRYRNQLVSKGEAVELLAVDVVPTLKEHTLL
jgi:hypothetical protein